MGEFHGVFARAISIIITIYQMTFGRYLGVCCKFYPTCSQYAKEAFEQHGMVRGLLLTIVRVMKCNPCSKGGVDFVPDRLMKKEKKL